MVSDILLSINQRAIFHYFLHIVSKVDAIECLRLSGWYRSDTKQPVSFEVESVSFEENRVKSDASAVDSRKLGVSTMPPNNNRRRSILCITTTKPSAALASGGGGSISLVDPQNGSIGSSLKLSSDLSGKVPIGTASLSLFPSSFSLSPQQSTQELAMGYGYTNKGPQDAYAFLLTMRGSSPPIMHWKGRLPEGHLTGGLLISPCGHYVVGGGKSGTLFVWNTLGGKLISTIKAHYRSILIMDWSECGRFLCTGGADGMVHVFSLSQLVAFQSKTSSSSTVQPIRTWPNHHLPVQGMVTLPSGRLATAGQDGQLLVLEISSETVLATIQLPNGITSLSKGEGSTLVAGCVDGKIHVVSMDQYAIHKITQDGTAVVRANNHSLFDLDRTGDSANAYRTELVGHERPVTSICVLPPSDEHDWMLCSGDEAGVVCVWDLESKICIRTIRPWGSAPTESSAKASKDSGHPITSIRIIDTSDESTATGHKSNSKTAGSLSSLVTPLQKFVEKDNPIIPVPFLRSQSSSSTFWDVANDGARDSLIESRLYHRKKRPRVNAKGDGTNNTTNADRVQKLELELAQAHETIERWQKVNNKLMERLQGSTS